MEKMALSYQKCKRLLDCTKHSRRVSSGPLSVEVSVQLSQWTLKDVKVRKFKMKVSKSLLQPFLRGGGCGGVGEEISCPVLGYK